MIAALRSMRLSRTALAVVAAVSGLATALVISTALGRTDAQSAAIAALQHPPVVVHAAAYARPLPKPATAPVTDSPPPAVTPAAPAPAAPAPSPAPAPSGGSGGVSTTTTSSTTTTTSSTTTTPATPQHKVGHVFVIALSTPSFDAVFGAQSIAHYLNGTLVRRGTLLGGYETLGRSELPDYLAMVSGQAPNAATRGNCATYSEFPANTSPSKTGEIPGDACVYPNTIITLADQVTSAGHTWKAYIDDMGPATCAHPNSDAPDVGSLPRTGADYDTRHNPFIYFHSLLDLGGCSTDDVSLDALTHDLHSQSTTPTLSFIAPRGCDDAATTTCADGQPAGLAGEDAFLRTWVPAVLGSPAYKRDGVLIITVALAGSAPAGGPVPTGTLVLSRFAATGKTIATTYNPYSVLRSVEDLLGYTPLAHAQHAKSFVGEALPGA